MLPALVVELCLMDFEGRAWSASVRRESGDLDRFLRVTGEVEP